MSTPTLLTIRQFAERNPAFTEPSLRWLIFRSSFKSDPTYGKYRAAIHRIGRRVFIDEVEFFEVAKSKGG